MDVPENSASNNKSDMSTSGAVNGEISTIEASNVNEQLPAILERQPSKLESFFAITKSLIIRALIIYFITSFFRRPSAPVATDSTGNVVKPVVAQNLFPNGTRMSLYVYVSEQEDFKDFQSPESLFWLKENLIYGDWSSGDSYDGTHTHVKQIPISNHLRNNGSLYLHAYLTLLGDHPDPASQFYAKQQMSYVRRQLNRFKAHKISTTKNLLTGESDVAVNATGKVISHWHPNMTLNLVVDHTLWSMGAVPAPMDEYIRFTADGMHYKPVLFANDFWNMARDYHPLEADNATLELHVTFQPLSMFKWQMYAAQTMRASWQPWGTGGNTGSESDEDQDTLKETLLDTNPYLLAITVAVSLLHSVFELLAFKNDIQFWNNRSSLEGLSVRSVFFAVFQSFIVLLYVLDNDTNTLIKVSCLVGLAIELWKIQKVCLNRHLYDRPREYECPSLSVLPISSAHKCSTPK